MAEKGSNILEIGFGLDIPTGFIQKHSKVKSHTVVEFHPDVIKNSKKMFGGKTILNSVCRNTQQTGLKLTRMVFVGSVV